MSIFNLAFFKRLGFYLMGLSIGIVFLTFFLKKKMEKTGVEFCYFPNCRVLKDLRNKPIAFSDDINNMLKNKQLDSLDITSFFRNGSIDFSKSDAKAKPCSFYFIEGEIKGKFANIKVTNCSEKVNVTELVYN